MKIAIAAIVLAATAVAHAEPDAVTERATDAERALLGELDKETFIKARDHAEAILEKTPDSFIATWAMARIQHDEEGNHARALYYVRRAQQLLQQQYDAPASWQKRLLLEEFSIDEEMDRSADALAVMARFKQAFGSEVESSKIWPLFKLGRIDEAREIGARLAASDDVYERRKAYNGMLALEFEAHDRAAAYKWSTEGIAATQGKSCILLRNGAGCSYTVFNLREAEELALKTHEAEDQDCNGAGYDELAGLYLIEGEFQKAIAAVKSLRAQPIPKRYRPHYALERRAILADILYALGKVEDAERLSSEVYALPERTGMTSSTKRHTDYQRTFRYWMTIDARIKREAEKASYRPAFAGVTTDNLVRAFTQWTLRRAMIQITADDDLIVTVTRPNLAEIYEQSSWTTMNLVDILGTGVMRGVVAVSRTADAAFPQAQAYYDLFDAEIDYKRGDLAGAIERATKGLAKLPREEAMLRFRTIAWQADALWRLGRAQDANALYHEVLQKVPSLMRILDLELPVGATSDGSPRAQDAAKRAAGSTRFRVVDKAPFKITASSAPDGSVELCLADASGFSFSCARGDKSDKDEDAILSALDKFHDAAFSPKIALEQADLNSLDGSPVRANADTALKGILEP